jgi:NADPH:quinone reductase-like Zn-dependent oxidoreductase
MSSSGHHLAALLTAAGAPLEVTSRPTPTPGPNQLLIEVKSLALNPLDHKQRDYGMRVASFPAVLGSDVAGTVISAGPSVPSDAPKPGTRVAAFAPCFFTFAHLDYGAFQTHVLVPSENVSKLPHDMSFNEATMLPLAALTAWSAWYKLGFPRDLKYTPADKQGILIWGGASSIGSAALQIARDMGFTVYATASAKHHAHLKSLGASKLFDYKSENVVQEIITAAKEDGVVVNFGYDAVGQINNSMEVLSQLKGTETQIAKLATAAHFNPDSLPDIENVEVKFILAPTDDGERTELFRFIFREWLPRKLEAGEFVPGTKAEVVGKGLESIQGGLDKLKAGVSGVKLVVEL